MSGKYTLMDHQKQVLELTKNFENVAYYLDMGLGKTFTGSHKLLEWHKNRSLIICQKSKVTDWVDHMRKFYTVDVIDLTKAKVYNLEQDAVFVINYDVVYRREILLKTFWDVIMLDESSYIQNDSAKRTKSIVKMHADHWILLSGTPCAGKYEKLYSQLKLLGMEMNKKTFYQSFIMTKRVNFGGIPFEMVVGYKNVDGLKQLMSDLGCIFMKTEDVLSLPEQRFITEKCNIPKKADYRILEKDRVLFEDDGITPRIVADTSLTYLLYLRMLLSPHKLEKTSELLESTEDPVLIFYNFNTELEDLKKLCKKLGKKFDEVNGQRKWSESVDGIPDVLLIQYQSGAMGLNCQFSNKIIYFSLPLSCELWQQSAKRTHRVGQKSNCTYWVLTCENSVEEKIYKTLEKREDYTNKLFESEYNWEIL